MRPRRGQRRRCCARLLCGRRSQASGQRPGARPKASRRPIPARPASGPTDRRLPRVASDAVSPPHLRRTPRRPRRRPPGCPAPGCPRRADAAACRPARARAAARAAARFGYRRCRAPRPGALRAALRRRLRAPCPSSSAKLDFDAYRDIRFRPDKALLGDAGGPFRMQMFHPGFLFNTPGHRQRDSRRHPDAGALFGRAVRLRPQQVRAAAAGQSRLRRLPPALSAERPARCTTS